MTIKAKIILAFSIVFGLMLSGFALLVYQSSRNAELSKLDAFLQSHAHKLQAEIQEQYHENQFPAIADFLSVKTDGLPNVHMQLFDEDGSVIVADSALPQMSRASVQAMLNKRPLSDDVHLQGEDYRLLLMPLEVNDRNTYLLQLASPVANIDTSLQHLRLLFLVGIPIALLLASLAAYLITRAAFRPVTSMVETARHISVENLEARLRVPTVNDEIRLLGETLNSMMERIQSAFNSQRQFIADASHELRTPLTVVCSELEFAQQQTGDPTVKESIRIAIAEIDRLTRMTQGMLMLSKLDASQHKLNPAMVRVDEVLVECVQLMKGFCAQKQIDLQLHIQEAVEITGDRDKLLSGVLNLLDNAAKYTNPGGVVSLLLSVHRTDPGFVSIQVQDTGVGIPPADLPHIFKRFYRAASSRAESPGSGLGLAIVEQVAKLHHGKVSVQSALEKGTTVTIQLPLQKG
jgi:signal transduction histidine kinase